MQLQYRKQYSLAWKTLQLVTQTTTIHLSYIVMARNWESLFNLIRLTQLLSYWLSIFRQCHYQNHSKVYSVSAAEFESQRRQNLLLLRQLRSSSIYAFEFLNIDRVHYCRFELPNFCSHFMKNMFLITLSLSWFFYCFTEPDFILSGQHTYNEHRNSITHAKFSPSGHRIASGDIDGVIKWVIILS